MILIKGCKAVDPKTGTERIADVLVRDGKIAMIRKRIEASAIEGADEKPAEGTEKEGENLRVIRGAGLTLAPGLIDVHVHFRDPGLTYKEDIQTGAAAAKKGGYTTVITMANTKPAVDSPETVKYILEEGKKTGIHVLPAAAVTMGLKGEMLTDMEALLDAGAVGFTDDGIPLMNGPLVMEAMEKAAALDVPLSFHEEDPAFIRNNGINHGAVSEKLGIYGSPAVAEDSLVARDCMIALHTGAAVNIQHISSARSVAMVRVAKKMGADVWAEVTPHHFTLTEDAVLEYGSFAKMNPPLRTEADRRALIEGLKDGTIDMIATDHAPHSAEEKARPLTEAPSGIIGLETALALGITELVRTGELTIAQLMEKMSFNPACLYHLEKGWLTEGEDADLVLFDENEEWTPGDYASKASNSPFTGWKLYGKVKYTICGGEIVYEDESAAD